VPAAAERELALARLPGAAAGPSAPAVAEVQQVAPAARHAAAQLAAEVWVALLREAAGRPVGAAAAQPRVAVAERDAVPRRAEAERDAAPRRAEAPGAELLPGAAQDAVVQPSAERLAHPVAFSRLPAAPAVARQPSARIARAPASPTRQALSRSPWWRAEQDEALSCEVLSRKISDNKHLRSPKHIRAKRIDATINE
jgi:hypothetical protein